MVSSPRYHRPDLPQVEHTSDRPVCNQGQQKLPLVHVPNSEHIMGGHGWGMPFPTTPLTANAINKILSHVCHRIIVIAPGWLNMWF